MQQKPSSSRSEPTWDTSAPVARPSVRDIAASDRPPTISRVQAPAPQNGQAPARRRLPGWLVGLIVIVGLGIAALLLALMVQVASDQVQRNQQQPVTRIIGR